MRKIWLISLVTLVSGFFFVSCDNLNVDPFDNFDGESAVSDFLFLATADDSTGVTKNGHGKCKMTEVAIADLPASITSYIRTNYTGSEILRAGTQDESGKYFVAVKKEDGSKVGVVFDADGNFLEEKTRGHKGEKVEIADLPAVITEYISANYSGAEIKKAFKGPEGRYGVIIQLEDDTFKGLGFDSEGAFLGEIEMKRKRKRRR